MFRVLRFMDNPNPTSFTSSVAKKPRKSIVAVIIIGACAAALVYAVWKIASRPELPKEVGIEAQLPAIPPPVPPLPSGAAGEDEKAMILAQFSNSTEIDAIEQDLRNTNLTGLDTELGAMEKEL